MEHIEEIVGIAIEGPCWDDGIEVLARSLRREDRGQVAAIHA
jgi:hypothetical protein